MKLNWIPQETVVAEAGAMNWMESDIAFEARMGDGTAASSGILGGLMSMGKRVLTGESLFMTHFTNQGVAKRRVAFSSPYPGKIMPVDLGQRGGTLMCQKDAFLCAAKGTKVSIAFTKRIGAGFLAAKASSCKSWKATAWLFARGRHRGRAPFEQRNVAR